MIERARPLAAPLVVVALLVAFPLVASGFYLEFTTKVMILAIFALSLELLVGATGLVSLGHAAFYGIAAYAAVLLSPKYGAANFFWLLPAAVACSALYALVIGALSLRTRGVYFIMVTLAFAQMAYYVFHDTKLGGGTDGIYLNFKPAVALFGVRLVDLGKPGVFYYSVLACLMRCSRFSRCCSRAVSAARWRASAATSSGCAPRASRRSPTSSPHSHWRARWQDSPAFSSPSRTVSSIPKCFHGTSPARCC